MKKWLLLLLLPFVLAGCGNEPTATLKLTLKSGMDRMAMARNIDQRAGNADRIGSRSAFPAL